MADQTDSGARGTGGSDRPGPGAADPAAGWYEEARSAWLYRALAASEAGGRSRALFARLADAADVQRGRWEAELRAAGRPIPTFEADLRSRVAVALAGRFGARRVRGVLAALKVRGLSALSVPEHAMPASAAEVGGRHRGRAGSLRAAVFGANDGLVSNASLLFGMSGASDDPQVVLMAGLGGLLAGAFSMAAGEFVSVQAQREMVEAQLALERAELALYPEEEARELALVYEARGLPPDLAAAVAAHLVRDPEAALQALAREELGVDPGELDSPWAAALSSFAAFAVGAVLPLAPFALLPGGQALPAAVAVTGAALFVVGAAIGLFSGRSAIVGGFRMAAIGGGAGVATWAIGRWLGAS